jgi:restriction system protein
MAIPTYEDLMLPILRILQDKKEHAYRELVESLAKEFQLTDEEKERRIPSGQQTYLQNRTGWARTHLKKSGFVEYVNRGVYRITTKGLTILQDNPQRIDNKFLRQFTEFVEWFDVKTTKTKEESLKSIEELEKTPDELLDSAYQTILTNLATEILETIKSCSPSFFERLVVELIVAMGYGGTLQDAGKAVGKSGDGGIDGIIKEDRLGLDVIYLQAKRWEGNVSRPEIQKFAGALLGNQARKGVFITTSDFTKEAKDYVKTISSNIILINGEELAELMIDYNVGVSVATTYEIKKIDSDYFSEE